MRKIYLITLLFLAIGSSAFSQALTGSKIINPGGGGDYLSFTAAINDLNTKGVGVGGVIFNVPAGSLFNEAGMAINTTTSTVTNPIVFQKSGVGADPVIYAKTTAGGDFDVALTIRGTDYVTFDGIDIVSDPAAVADADKTEYGIALYNSGNSGCDHITIKNSVINIDPRSTGTIEQYGIVMSQGASLISGIISNVVIDNVTFIKGRTSIYIYTQSIPNESIEIKNCKFGDPVTATSPLDHGSLFKSDATKNLSFHDNEIKNIVAPNFLALNIDNYRGVSLVYNNKIHNLRSTSTDEISGLTGIYMNSGDVTAEMDLYNNLVYDLDGSRAVNTASSQFYRNILAVYGSGTAKLKIYNNTITGSSANANENIVLALAGTNAEFKNNIIADYSVPGTYSYRSLISSDGIAENNLFWIDESLANNYTYSGSTYYKFKSWQKGTAKPSPGYFLNNILADPSFTDKAAFNFIPTNPSPASNNGQPLASVTSSINGVARSATTPDIGAYEGDFGTTTDLYPPVIRFQALQSVLSGTVKLTANIADNIGVTTAILWYRAKAATTTFIQVSGIQYGNIWEFTFPALSTGSYEYFLCAKDTEGNVISNGFMTSGLQATSTGLVTNNPAANPDYVYSFSFGQTLGGAVTVGTGGTYTSLTNTGGLFDAINSSLVSANITASIISDLTESGTITLKQWQESGTGNYTLTIQPNSATLRTISNSNPTAVTLEGADRVTIDGSFTGDNTSHLTFSAANTNPLKLLSTSDNNGCTNIAVRYCSFTSVSWSCISSTGINHSDITIENISSPKGYSGLSLTGITRPIIRNSVFGSTDLANTLMSYGIALDKCSDILIETNNVRNIVNTTNDFNTFGIRVSNTTGGSISRNIVTNVSNTSASGSEISNGITLSSSKNLTVSNNIVSGVNGTGSSVTYSTEGIKGIVLVTCDNVKFYYNTINMFGTGNTVASGVCFALTTEGSTNLDISNNIFSNAIDNAIVPTYTKGVIQSTVELSNNFRNNIYYVGGTKASDPFTISSVGGLTFALWRSSGFTPGNGRDLGSSVGDPKFTAGATNDVTLQATSPALNSALPVAVTFDYNNATRSATTPDIGAFEDSQVLSADIIAPVISYVPFDNSSNLSPVFTATITDNVGVTAAKMWYRVKGTATAFTAISGSQSGNTWSFAVVTPLTLNNEYEYFICAVDAAGNVGVNGITESALDAVAVGLTNNTPAASPLFVRSFKVTDASIVVGAITGAPFYVSNTKTGTISIPFTATGPYTSNTFTAYLSNSTGSFASEVSIGSLVSNASGTITGTLPVSLSGTGYMVRVKASSPVIVSNPSPVFQVINDNTSPVVTLSNSAGNPVSTPITLTIEFSEAVTAFTVDKITATNATLSAFTVVTTDKKFTVLVTPINSGTVTVKVEAGKVTDLAGNNNAESNTINVSYIETGVPHLNITSAGSVTYFNTPTITLTFTFDQDVTDFLVGDIVVTNGAVSGFATTTARIYTAILTPAGQGPVSITVPDDAALNGTLKGNSASTLNLNYDSVKPTVALSMVSGSSPINVPFDVYVDFSEEITGMTIDKITVTNGTASNLVKVSITRYKATIALPLTDGTVTIGFAAGLVSDAATNTNSAATDLAVVVDRVGPTPVVSRTSGSGPVSGAFGVTIGFNEAVTGFDLTGITVTNGTASAFAVVNALTYTATITPLAEGDVLVSVAATKAKDLAGNDNVASNTLTVTADLTAPTVVITRTTGSGSVSGLFNITCTFSEPVNGFDLVDLTVGNGTASNPVMVSSSVYTADITPTAAGNVTVDIAAGVATDLAGNPNIAAVQFVILNIPLGDVTLKGEAINVYPNPSTGAFKIELGHVNDQIIKIFDLNGKSVYSDHVKQTVTDIEMNTLPKGIYMLHLIEGNKVTLKKIIIK